MIDVFRARMSWLGWDVTEPVVAQTLTEHELISLLPYHDGWIIGDDPACISVLEAGAAGRLRAAVKWGVGVDNIDFEAARELGISISNTPGVFGAEVADVAMGYVIGLARETFRVDREIRGLGWPKPPGISLANKTVGIIGLGDIGRNLIRRVAAADMKIIGFDPGVTQKEAGDLVDLRIWPNGLGEVDFLVATCALNNKTRHMVNEETLALAKPGLRLINVCRGPVVKEAALCAALDTGQVHSAALDVFEVEPLEAGSPLRRFDRCILGSHNASNTSDAVRRVSEAAIDILDLALR